MNQPKNQYDSCNKELTKGKPELEATGTCCNLSTTRCLHKLLCGCLFIIFNLGSGCKYCCLVLFCGNEILILASKINFQILKHFFETSQQKLLKAAKQHAKLEQVYLTPLFCTVSLRPMLEAGSNTLISFHICLNTTVAPIENIMHLVANNLM